MCGHDREPLQSLQHAVISLRLLNIIAAWSHFLSTVRQKWQNQSCLTSISPNLRWFWIYYRSIQIKCEYKSINKAHQCNSTQPNNPRFFKQFISLEQRRALWTDTKFIPCCGEKTFLKRETSIDPSLPLGKRKQCSLATSCVVNRHTQTTAGGNEANALPAVSPVEIPLLPCDWKCCLYVLRFQLCTNEALKPARTC